MQCTKVQGGFDAPAHGCPLGTGAVGRDVSDGLGGLRPGSGQEDQDRRRFRPDRAPCGRRLRAQLCRREDRPRPFRQDRRRRLQDRSGLRRRAEQARHRHQRIRPPARAGEGRHGARLLLIGAMRARGRACRAAQEVHVDDDLHLVGRVQREGLQIRVPSAGERRPVRHDDDGFHRPECQGQVRQGAEGSARRHHPRGRRLWRRRFQGQRGGREESRLQRRDEGGLFGDRAGSLRAGDQAEARASSS